MEWLPIETAPKDGSEILVGHKDGSIDLAHYEKRAGGFMNQESWSCNWASHWMPLPPPPKATE